MRNPYKSRDDRDTRQSLKGMTFKEKREHIWAYYKLHMAIGALVVFVIGLLTNTYFINPPKKAWISVAIYNMYMEENDKDALRDLLFTLIPEEDAKRYKIDVQQFLLNSADYTYVMTAQITFDSLLSAGAIDLIITGDETYQAEIYGTDFFEYAEMIDEANKIWAGTVYSGKNKDRARDALPFLMK